MTAFFGLFIFTTIFNAILARQYASRPSMGKIKNIPDDKLWDVHTERKVKLLKLVKDNTTERLRRAGYNYEEINEIVSKLDPNALTIGFARRFATYKRATLIFKDLERITQILNNQDRPVQLIFAGKAHPADKEGQDLIKYIHQVSMMPQFKGKSSY